MCRPILKIYQLCHVCIVEFTGHLLSDRDTTSSTRMGAGVNGNNQWEWDGNWNKTRLNLGLRMRMGINYWEWEEMGLKKIFPLISTPDPHAGTHCQHLKSRCRLNPNSSVHY